MSKSIIEILHNDGQDISLIVNNHVENCIHHLYSLYESDEFEISLILLWISGRAISYLQLKYDVKDYTKPSFTLNLTKCIVEFKLPPEIAVKFVPEYAQYAQLCIDTCLAGDVEFESQNLEIDMYDEPEIELKYSDRALYLVIDDIHYAIDVSVSAHIKRAIAELYSNEIDPIQIPDMNVRELTFKSFIQSVSEI